MFILGCPLVSAGCSLAPAGCAMLAAGCPLNASGCSLREMGSRPDRWMDAPEPVMEHPEVRTCNHERRMEHPAPLMGHPERRSSHPEAFMEHPGRNGAAVFRGKSTIPGRKVVPGGQNRRFGRENGFIADVGWNGRDWSTEPARAVSPIFRTDLLVLNPAKELLQRHAQAPRQPCQHMHSGDGFTAFHPADRIA